MITSQRGVASLLAVSLTSLLILIITISATALMVGELRQAIDAENGIRAYYAAQSAAEKGIDSLKTQLAAGGPLASINQACQTVSYSEANITCQEIRTSTQDLDSIFSEQDNTVQFDLTYAVTKVNSSVDHIILAWDGKSLDGAIPFSDYPVAVGPGASNPAPPLMEATITNYYPGQQAIIDETQSGSVFLLPCYDTSQPYCAGRSSQMSLNGIFNGGGSTFANASIAIKPTSCELTTSSGYRCKIELDNITNRNPGVAPSAPNSNAGYKTILRLRTRYGAARYHLEVYDIEGQKAQIPLQNAQVDVTAKAGESFRRLTLEVPIRSGAYSADVLYADADLCKDLQILQAPGYFGALQPPGSTCPIGN